jgi:iron complex outermembrane recepter protein
MFMNSLSRDILLTFAILALLCQSASAQENIVELMSMSMEELMDIEVSLTSRTEIRLFETAAATFVLTGDDIRRAGVTSLPEALRLVPGMQVASIDANKWAISARGFANRFANKLLVLVDGRHIYSPLFAGVFWEALDVVLEDVERIEVVRGPGATLWGANAVNGIVNIVTRGAKDTQGFYGGFTRSFTGKDKSRAGHYGGRLKGGGYYRVYGKHFGRDRFFDTRGRGVDDEWEILGGGFRGDWKKRRDSFSLQGGLYSNEIEQNLPPERSPPAELLDASQDAAHTGGHLLARWHRALSPRSDFSLKGYYDLYERDDGLNDTRSEAYEIDFQHHFAPRPHRDLIWGLSYRRTRDETRGSFELSFEPSDADGDLYSAFVHGEAALIDGRLRLAVGTKLEHNQYTDLEYQPSGRIIWTPDENQALWAAVTRAVRTPALSDFRFAPDFSNLPEGPSEPPENPFVSNRPDFQSETLRALEVGYRFRAATGLFFDLAAYYNDYAGLRLVPLVPSPFAPLPGTPPSGSPPPGLPPGPRDIEPVDAATFGGELVADWKLDRGRLRATWALVDFDLPAGAPHPAGTEPELRFYLWPSLDLGAHVQVDAILRHVNPLGRPRFAAEAVEFASALAGYTDLDLRLAWRPGRRLELSIVGQNLLDEHRPEFTGFVLDSQPSEIRRVVFGAMRWTF